MPNHHFLILAHAGGSPQKFVFPKVVADLFLVAVHQYRLPPRRKTSIPNLDGPAPPADWTVELESRSLVCYVARDEV